MHDLSAENVEGGGIRLTFDLEDAATGDVLGRLARLGVTSLVSTPPSLEDLFLRHYGDEIAATAAEASR